MFQPVGERARWELIYEQLQPLAAGTVITYKALSKDLGLTKPQLIAAMRRAMQELLLREDKALEALPNVGWRIVDAAEHLGLARRQQKKAKRSLVRGHDITTHVDMRRLTPEMRAIMDATARAFAMQMDFNRRFDVRQARLEALMQQVTTDQQRSDQEIARLQARLDRLEQPAD